MYYYFLPTDFDVEYDMLKRKIECYKLLSFIILAQAIYIQYSHSTIERL